MRSDARKREAAPSEVGALTEAERDALREAVDHDETCPASGEDNDTHGVFAAVGRIKAEAVQAERERVAEWLESDGAVEAVAAVLEIAMRPDELVYEFQEREARSALAALAAHAKGEAS